MLQLKTGKSISTMPTDAPGIRFDHTLYPGYSHRRTLGFQDGVSPSANEEIAKKVCKTYVFTLKKEEEEKPKKRKQEFKSNKLPKKKFKK